MPTDSRVIELSANSTRNTPRSVSLLDSRGFLVQPNARELLGVVIRAICREGDKLPRDLGSSLTQLEHLEFRYGDVQLSSEDFESFSAFKHSLKYITLGVCCISASTLVSLIDYFPELKRLFLINVGRLDSDECAPPLDSQKTLRELIVLHKEVLSSRFPDLLQELSSLNLHVNRLVFEHNDRDLRISLFNPATSAFGANVERLATFHFKCDLCFHTTETPAHNPFTGARGLNLSPYVKLRELEFKCSEYPPGDLSRDLISTISSENIEKIIIDCVHERKIQGDWASFDTTLTALARLKPKGRGIQSEGGGIQLEESKIQFEVEFRCSIPNDAEFLSGLLPKFANSGGRITVE